MTRALRLVIATWFGSGFAPVASGTAGTLATVPLVLLLWWLGAGWWLHLLVAVTVAGAGIWAADDAERIFRRKDPAQVVVDEAAGYLVSTLALPATLPVLALSFVVFRVMDIVKPFPARRLERLPRGWGIMADDLAAGVYANLVVWGLLVGWEKLA